MAAPKTSEFFATDPRFGSAFAVFLRQHPHLWRIRRSDFYRPRDLNLADHRVSLQGRIDPALLDLFFHDGGAGLPLRKAFEDGDPEFRAGDKLTVYLPVTSQPKRLLLDFSIGHGAKPGGLPMLNRYEDCWIEALNLLSLTGYQELLDHEEREDIAEWRRLLGADGAAAFARAERDRKTFPLLLVLATLVFINPGSIDKRIAHWDRKRQAGDPEHNVEPKPAVTRPLQGDELLDWIEEQGEFFLPGLGWHLRRKLGQVVDQLLDTELTIAQTSRRDVLHNFESVPSLLLHGIRDLLKLLHYAAPEWPGGKQDDKYAGTILTRDELLENPRRLAKDVFDLVVDGLSLLEDLLGSDRGSSGAVALTNDLDYWWAFVQLEVELGAPFMVKTSEILPLYNPEFTWAESVATRRWSFPLLERAAGKLEQWYRTVKDTGHYYPIALKDAQSVHIEVEVPHAELRMPPVNKPNGLRLKAVVPDGVADSAEFEQQPLEPDFEFVFGDIDEPSDRLFHTYSSRQIHEAPKRDILNPWLKLYVPLRFRPSIFIGFTALVVAYCLAAIFIGFDIGRAIAENGVPGTAVITVGALAVSLSLWMTGANNSEPVVAQKLVVARHLLELFVGLMLLEFTAYGIYKLADLLGAFHATTGASHTATHAAAGLAAFVAWLLHLLKLWHP